MLEGIRTIVSMLLPRLPDVPFAESTSIIDDAATAVAADENESRVYLNAAADNIRAIAGRVCDRVAETGPAKGKGVIT